MLSMGTALRCFTRSELVSYRLTATKPAAEVVQTLKAFKLYGPRGCRAGTKLRRRIPTRVTYASQRKPNLAQPRSTNGGCNVNNLVLVNVVKWEIPTVINTNVHGALSSKTDEIHTIATMHRSDIVCITETWCSLTVPDATLQMPSYTAVRRDRQNGKKGGGLMLYLRDTLPFRYWGELDDQMLETIWVTVAMQRLPREISNITIGLIYHPPGNKDRPMLDHIAGCIDHIHQKYPDTGVLLCGDFNQLKDSRIQRDLHLMQLVQKPTRGKAILDKTYTNFPIYYGEPEVMAPIGLSDHCVVVCRPALQTDYKPPMTYMAWTRCTGANEKAMLLLALRNAQWGDLYRAASCQQQYAIFEDKLRTLIDTHMPSKLTKRCSNDKPWVTDEFRILINRRKAAFRINSVAYSCLRNKANRMRKSLRKTYFSSKISGAASGGRQWWRCVKEVTGANFRPSGLRGLINSTSGGCSEELANKINQFLHSVNSHFKPLQEEDYTHGPHEIPSKFIISVEQVEQRLCQLNPRKGEGPDGIPTWLLREYAHLLAPPVCAIYNSSIRESELPAMWRCATVVPIPKCNPPKTVERDLRPVSLTPVLAKELEFFVCGWIMKQTGHLLDNAQFGAIKNSSTVHALVDMLHDWAGATDSRDTMVRALLLDYRKAFDLIDHHILMSKLGQFGLPDFIVSWVAAFLHGRQQRVRVGEHLSAWLPVHGGVPQGTRVGPIVFLFMINDLLEDQRRVKFVDDTVTWECCHVSGRDSRLQVIANDADSWSDRNGMQLNVDKTKEMIVSFSRKHPSEGIPPLTIGGAEIERITSAKVLGVVVSSNLSWQAHIDYICPNASRRLYFLSMLRRAGASRKDLLTFYKATVRSAVEYACVVWHTGLTGEQADRLESVQRRALNIIEPGSTYEQALADTGLEALHARRERLARSFYHKVQDPEHKLHHLLPGPRQSVYYTRQPRKYTEPRLKTSRAKNTVINYGMSHW